MTITSILDAFSTGRFSEYLSKTNALASRMALWLEKRAQRRALLEMTDEQLRDIGLSRCDALREASKSSWSPWL